MTSQEIADKLTARFGSEKIHPKFDVGAEPVIIVAAAAIRDIGFFLRDDEEMQFGSLMCLSGIDLKGKYAVVYHLSSITFKHKITLRIELSTENLSVPSVESIWKTADWHEREAFDMYGIIFSDHPDLRRILMPYDWEGYPLRKDYQVPEFYNGMKVPY